MIFKVDGRTKGSNLGRYGELASNWKGSDVSYKAKHKWLYERYGKADRCESESCLGASTVYQWANISGEYKREREDYKMMCGTCHRLFDNPRDTYCKRGHEWNDRNTYWHTPAKANIPHRRCRECKNTLRRNK